MHHPQTVVQGIRLRSFGVVALAIVVWLAGCEGHRTSLKPVVRDAAETQDSSMGIRDMATWDVVTAERVPYCETLPFAGTLNGMAFAEALRTYRTNGPGYGVGIAPE